MKKQIPRKWYSLEVAAKRLSVFFNDDLTIKDILELALENEIRICWDMREHYLQPEKINDFPTGEVFQAAGYYEISISEYPWHNEWLKELIRETPPNELATNKLIVKDNHGNKFTIVSPLWTKTDSGRNVQYFGGDFYPSIVDIFIYAKDLEEFEEKYPNEEDQPTPKKTNKNQRIFEDVPDQDFLNAIGIMATILAQKITGLKKGDSPNADKISEKIQAEHLAILGTKGQLSKFQRAITKGIESLEQLK